jgi:hypothetical protein
MYAHTHTKTHINSPLPVRTHSHQNSHQLTPTCMRAHTHQNSPLPVRTHTHQNSHQLTPLVHKQTMTLPSPGPRTLANTRVTSRTLHTTRPSQPHASVKISNCRRFEPGGSLDRRVIYRRVPQPRWVSARRSAKGGRSRRETGVRGEIPRPSCLSRAQVGCACSRGLQASTREGASGLTRAPSRPSPRGQPSVRGPWSFLL